VNFNFLFQMKSWQSVLAADVETAIKRGMAKAGEGRRINLIDCEASLDHMLLSIGGRKGGRSGRMKHLITGASARLSLRAAPDIRLNAGVSNFWQTRYGSQPGADDSLATGQAELRKTGAEETHEPS
jgi:Transposase IS200 like